MDKKKQFSIEILNGFVNIIITDVADKYLKKLKKDKKNPPKLIENYLDKAVFLTNQNIEILTVSRNINVMDEEVKNEFNYLIKQDKEYQSIVQELNFAFNLIKHEEIQFKVLTSLYQDFIKLNQEQEYQYDKNEKEKINFNAVIRKFNKNKKMTSELNYFF